VSHIRQFCGRTVGLSFALVSLAACSWFGGDSSSSGAKTPLLAAIKNVSGAAAADEPQAVVEARTILAQGGTAADAAVAIYFTLSATLPSSASLGGGGMCLVYDAKSAKVEALDFLARVPAASVAVERPSAVPGNPMGFWTLHSRYGKLPWSQIVAPAERHARLGSTVSRVLAADLAPVAAPLLQDPESRKVFADPTGRPLSEGGKLLQSDLARVLSVIRLGGAADFYRGAIARDLVAGAKAAGGSLELSDLENFRAEWRQTIQIKDGNVVAHFTPPPAAAGAIEAQMSAMIADRARFSSASVAERMHILAETSMRGYADRARWMRDDYSSADSVATLVSRPVIDRLARSLDPQRHTAPASFDPPPAARPENPSATSFVVADATGSSVACALTMNNSFGTGRMAKGTGVMLAAAPSAQGRGPASLGPMIVVNESSKQLFFAGAASGGVAAPSALINVAAGVLMAQQTLDAAMKAPRVHHGGSPDITYVEPDAKRDDVAQLTSLGHTVATTPTLGVVNVISCPGGMPRDKNTCAAMADPRGHGVAMFSND
jgi:gamma-glutamyltranspeptidase/glutathione hydrolase